MYLGSVNFFKHLIIAFIVLIIGTLAFFVVYLSGQNSALKEERSLLLERPDLLSDAVPPEEAEPHTPEAPSTEKPYDSPEPPEEPESEPAQPEKPEYAPSFLYQELYPELYSDEEMAFERTGEKTVYLTFDDGPSSLTSSILRTLKRHDVKATFFVVGKNVKGNEDLLRQILEDGHALGLHSNSHLYTEIYVSVETFLKDFDTAYRTVYEVTGEKPFMFRFPGGSINAYNATTYQPIIAEMLRRGFVYHDWNISAGDAVSSFTAKSITANVLDNYKRYDNAIILMHERSQTAEALSGLIEEMKRDGRFFDKLTNKVAPVTFPYPR